MSPNPPLAVISAFNGEDADQDELNDLLDTLRREGYEVEERPDGYHGYHIK